MRIKLDVNVGIRGVDVLVAAGHDVTTAGEQGMVSASDETLLRLCAAEGRCLVTMDLDFANPLEHSPQDSAGVAVIRLPPRPRPEDLTQAFLTFIEGVAAEDIAGRLWVIRAGRIRRYEPGG